VTLPPFTVTYDYRCPFARNAHEHLVEGLRDGAGWEVGFVPFSLSQAHVEEGAPSVWDDPAKAASLLAVEAGLVVRDRDPERFADVHLALFAARHDEGRDLREEAVVRDILTANGVDADDVMAAVAQGWPHEAFRKEHEAAVDGHRVFGVPTFVTGDRAVFVRLTTRPQGDASLARATIEHVMGLLVEHPELNEFKHTSIDR
jgi:protein-disulfide isomerase-like protein with CxxC motif